MLLNHVEVYDNVEAKTFHTFPSNRIGFIKMWKYFKQPSAKFSCVVSRLGHGIYGTYKMVTRI